MPNQVRVLSLNLSFAGLMGTRKLYDSKTKQITQYRYLKNKKVEIYPGIIPCSNDSKLPQSCFINLSKFIAESSSEFDIITLIEANDSFIQTLIAMGILQTKKHYRIGSVGEIIHVFANPSLNLMSIYTVNLAAKHEKPTQTGKLRYRPIGVLLFEKIVFVAVHLPHEEKKFTSQQINGIVDQILGEIFFDHDQLPIIIAGDFNNETQLVIHNENGQNIYQNSNLQMKTAYLLVDTVWPDTPLQFAYDRFVWANVTSLKYGIYLPSNYQTLSDQLEMSDHLPIYGYFQLPGDMSEQIFLSTNPVDNLELDNSLFSLKMTKF